MDKPKKSFGRDAFGTKPGEKKSQALKKILEGTSYKEAATAKELEVKIKLTPSNIKHLDILRVELEKAGKGRFTRNELIRIAVTLLATGDF